MTETVGGDEYRRILGLKDGLQDLKRELRETRELLQGHLEGAAAEAGFSDRPPTPSSNHARWQELLAGRRGERFRKTYEALRGKGMTRTQIVERLVSRGNDPEDAERLVSTLEQVDSAAGQTADHNHL